MAEGGDSLRKALIGLDWGLGWVGNFLGLNRELSLVEGLGADAVWVSEEVVDVAEGTIELVLVLFGANPFLS